MKSGYINVGREKMKNEIKRSDNWNNKRFEEY